MKKKVEEKDDGEEIEFTISCSNTGMEYAIQFSNNFCNIAVDVMRREGEEQENENMNGDVFHEDFDSGMSELNVIKIFVYLIAEKFI